MSKIRSATTSGRRGRAARALAGLSVVGVLAAACSSGPGSREDFIEVLTRDGSLTTEEATCISDAVFDEYEADEDALQKISGAPSFEYLRGEEGVPGFAEFFEETVEGCAQVGPTRG